MEENGPNPKGKRFLLVYGSETGQAKSIAEEIAEKSLELGLQADLHSLEETGKRFNIENENCVVIVTSTTGDGDPPSNASKFMRRIRKRTLSNSYLAHLQYALLGLGDTNYSNFCRCAQDMDKRFEQLGASRFYPTGLADDGVGLEVVAEPWLEGLYPALQNFLNESQRAAETSSSSEHGISAANSADTQNSNPVINDSVSISVNSCKNINDDFEDKKREGITEFSLPGNESKDENSSTITSVDSSSRIHSNMNGDCEPSNANSASKVDPMCDLVSNCETLCVKVNVTNVNCKLNQPSPRLEGKTLTIPVLSPPFLQISYTDKKFETSALPYQNNCKLPSAASEIITLPVTSARILTGKDALKKTLLLTLDHKEQTIDYHPGDAISIISPNSQSEIDLLFERLNLLNFVEHKMSIDLIPDTKKRRAAVPPHVHPITTLRYLFRHCVSVRDPPSKALLRALVEYTADDSEVRRLQELCSKEGASEYTECIREKHVSILDLLYAFQSCHPPIQRLIEFLPRLQPRPYSICSFSGQNPHSFDIVFNVVTLSTEISNGNLYHRRGVCTGWLDDITGHLQTEPEINTSSVKIPIFLRTNQHFRPPIDLAKPLIMVGPGTGVAPFIGFLQQRACAKNQSPDASPYGETWLFYGCRNKLKDYLFRKELEEFHASGVLSRLCVAVSRDEAEAHRYVQDFIQTESSSLANLIVDDDALIYVCGDAQNMAKDVGAAFEKILINEKGLTSDEAHLAIMKKRLHKSYFEDVWV